jgi:hypothetical protein
MQMMRRMVEARPKIKDRVSLVETAAGVLTRAIRLTAGD